MINVLHFFKTYYPNTYGGIEQVIFQICEGAAQHGVNSIVEYVSPSGDSDIECFHHHKIVRDHQFFDVASTPFSISSIRKFKKLAESADIIHYHFPYPFSDVLHFICGVNKPTVVSYHSDIIKQKYLLKLYKPLMNKFLGSVTAIVATSPNYLATSETLRKFDYKASVIPIGIDESHYRVSDKINIEKWRSFLPERFFLFIGNLRYYKGLNTLIDAMGENEDIDVVIIGSGPLDKELKEKVAERKIDNIHFLGALPDEDKNTLLELCYGIVFPSQLRTEAFGITLLEGAMYGKPLISCEIGTGTSFINIHRETGLVIKPSDPKELSNAMKFIWENKDISQEMGNNAKKRFFELFTADKMVGKYVELYKECLKSNK
ncbi:glycosyltransferase family 4 protein [Erwinia sp. V71]|uniref:glycosyltransferase family 4 protein n=1 Tax=Erwinia sp. V71 TaxID=3369424 RepID=UPI003F5FC6F3